MDTALATRDVPQFKTRIGKFFYADEVPYGLAIVRITLPLVLLAVVLPRWVHSRELFSSDGAASPIALSFGFVDYLPEVSGTTAVALMTVLGICLVASSIGWCTRAALMMSFVIYTYLNMLDSLSTITKYSVIASHCLLILSLSHCGSIWSVDSWLKGTCRRRRRFNASAIDWPASPIWPRRMMQILIGSIYIGSAFTKLHTSGFLSSDQLRSWMMSNVNNANPVGEYLSLYPAVLVVMSHIAIIFQIVFLFLCWKGWPRIILLTMGAMFHLSTTPLLGLYIFPAIMIAIYFCFLSEDDVRKMKVLVARFRRKSGWKVRRPVGVSRRMRWLSFIGVPQTSPYPSAMVFGFLLVFAAVIGIEVEHQWDPYGIRRPEGPYTLREVDPAKVREMLRPAPEIRSQDKVLALELGSKMLGGVLVNHKSTFRQGEPVLVQCTLIPPHEDMWIECNLHDHNDRVIDRVGQIAPRSMVRCNFVYHLSEALTPGRYCLVLKSAGIELERKTIALTPRLQAPAVN